MTDQATVPSAANPDRMLDEAFLRRLERLSLIARRMRQGRDAGHRRSPSHGQSIEFADFRAYTPGDDPRRLDWNAYARFGRLFMRLYHDDQNQLVHVLVDVSASMDSGVGQQHKLTWARRLAAALGYLALSDLDRVRLTAIAGSVVHDSRSIHGGTRAAQRLMTELNALHSAATVTALDTAFAAFRRATATRGPLIVISDLLCPGHGATGLRDLRAAGFDVTVVHVLSPGELDPDLERGDLRLRDQETGQTRDITVDDALLERYRQAVKTWRAEIRARCLQDGIAYVPVSTADSLESVVLGDLRRERVVA